MPVSIRIPNSSFTYGIASLSLPNRNGLIGEFIFGGDAAKSTKNRASPLSPPSALVATPTYGANYAQIKSGGAYGSVGFDLGFVCPRDATVIAIVQKEVSLPAFMGSDVGGFVGFYNYANTPALYNSQSGSAAQVASLPLVTSNKFVFYAGKMPIGGKGIIYGAEAGSLVSVESPNAGAATRGAGTLKVGTSLTNAGLGTARIAYAAIFERVLTTPEIESAYASLKAFLTLRGVDME